MAITTKRYCGTKRDVSQSTVSRCLNDSPMIPEKTKEKDIKIAEEHGFSI